MMNKFVIDGNGLLRPIIRPLICTVVYGSKVYFDCLRYLLTSLTEFGNYRGAIAIFSDRPIDSVLKEIPEVVTSQIIQVPLHDVSLTGRYTIADYDVGSYFPIMYLDNDIIVNRDLMKLLDAISMQSGISVTTEAETYRELSTDRIPQVQDVRRVGNWFGLEICRMDPSCCDDFLPVANSGIIGFRDRETFQMLASLVRDLYRHPAHADVAKFFTDQPFLNYALVKTRLGEYKILDKSCSFLGAAQSFPEDRCGFAHFIWARGEDKPRLMESYLRHLRSETTPAGVVQAYPGEMPVLESGSEP